MPYQKKAFFASRTMLVMITATFLGYKLSGFWGALMATLAIFSPAFFIVTLLIPHYDRVRGMTAIRTMEQGILA
jgi:chromate transporter